MYSHFYKVKFVVRYNYYDYINIEDSLNIEIIPVYRLLKFVDCGKNMSLIIEPNKWRNIALLNVSKDNISEITRHGAEIIKTTLLYDDEIDAKLQMAFVCSKYLVEPEKVYSITNGTLNSATYKQLLQIFYDDFPEKFI